MEEKKRIQWEKDMGQFLEYLTDQERSPATVEKYLRDIRTFRRYLQGKRQVSKEILLEYKEWLRQNYTVNSANSMIVALNQFLICTGCGRMRLKQIRTQSQAPLNLR